MSHSPSGHKLDLEERRKRDASAAAALVERLKTEAYARRIVALWNARAARGRALFFFPTIGAAIAGGHPWLRFSCPGCNQIGEADLRTLDRHPDATIDSLISALSCRRCRPHPPFAKLTGLFDMPVAAEAAKERTKRAFDR